ncbi:MAG: Gfo/Idh/MocA family oxidoreductase [Pseudomonadales bacterium]|nr:Gfo/Idh/MocA family oxidoreductase [Pseudomonadales bacterium]
MQELTRYAIVGTGGRYAMYLRAIARDFNNRGRVVGLCDINPHRVKLASEYHEKLGGAALPTYGADTFDAMIAETKPDVVIVTSVDRTHDRYIIRAMELGCDVISEKPMTTDADKCQSIIDAMATTGRKLRVTFNYRYAPRNSKVKELLMQRVVGNIKSVHFEWLLDTRHGADYFRRWHRDKRNSGGLLVHKATHHFDLVNWWLASHPRTVFAMGDLVFYGRDNAESRGVTDFYQRGTDDPIAAGDPFALDLRKDKLLKRIYFDGEHADGYRRDQSVFSDGISIEDDMSVLVRYENRVTMTYHLTAYSPWEGYRVAFNGDAGRLEYEVHENSYISGAEDDANRADAGDIEIHEPARIMVRPHWRAPYEVTLDNLDETGHGGGDARLLQDLFDPGEDDPLGRAANHIDGARSILTGIAANRSIQTGLPVDVRSLVRFN